MDRDPSNIQPVAGAAPAHGDCQHERRRAGLAYPRTCDGCGVFGPCRYGHDATGKVAATDPVGPAIVGERPAPRPGQITDEQLTAWFTHHPPACQREALAYESIRAGGKQLAAIIVLFCPPGPDTTAAVRKVREAVMTANAAVACNGR